jgi:hypothetical protein
MKRLLTKAFTAAIVPLILLAAPAAADEPLKPDSITASSTLEDGVHNYTTYSLSDYNSSTAWVEAVPGNGIGETLTYEFPAGTVLTGGVIYTGYQKSHDTFYRNSAPTRLQIMMDTTVCTVDVTYEANHYIEGGLGEHLFTFDKPVTLRSGMVTVTILEVRPGWLYEDTCISDLRFTGNPASAAWNTGYSGESVPDPAASSGFAGGTATAAESLRPNRGQMSDLTRLAQRAWICHKGYDSSQGSVWAKDLTAEEQALFLYWYQYTTAGDERIQDEGYLHAASDYDLHQILTELFGDNLKPETMTIFQQEYQEYAEEGIIYMNATGDFGDSCGFEFDMAEDYWWENGLLGVTGRIMTWNDYMQSFIHSDQYTAYYKVTTSSATGKTVFCLDHVNIGF